MLYATTIGIVFVVFFVGAFYGIVARACAEAVFGEGTSRWERSIGTIAMLCCIGVLAGCAALVVGFFVAIDPKTETFDMENWIFLLGGKITLTGGALMLLAVIGSVVVNFLIWAGVPIPRILCAPSTNE